MIGKQHSIDCKNTIQSINLICF